MSQKAYEIKFVGIELLSKAISDPPDPLKQTAYFSFNFLVDIKLDPPNKNAGVLTTVDILYIKESGEKNNAANFKILCVFELPDFDAVFTKTDNNKYDIPIDMEILLKSAGLSTIRGIIYSEVRGTYLHAAILPLIDINELVRDQHVQKEQNSS